MYAVLEDIKEDKTITTKKEDAEKYVVISESLV